MSAFTSTSLGAKSTGGLMLCAMQDTLTKLKWIQSTALALNPQDPFLAPHVRPILEHLYQGLPTKHRSACTWSTPSYIRAHLDLLLACLFRLLCTLVFGVTC